MDSEEFINEMIKAKASLDEMHYMFASLICTPFDEIKKVLPKLDFSEKKNKKGRGYMSNANYPDFLETCGYGSVTGIGGA